MLFKILSRKAKTPADKPSNPALPAGSDSSSETGEQKMDYLWERVRERMENNARKDPTRMKRWDKLMENEAAWKGE